MSEDTFPIETAYPDLGSDYVNLGLLTAPLTEAQIRSLPLTGRRGAKEVSKVRFLISMTADEFDVCFGDDVSRVIEERVIGDSAAYWKLCVHASRLDHIDRYGMYVTWIWASIDPR